ncbi:MAG: SMC-Scp complex subunit ScpB [Ignavibacteria bacterium]
MVSTEIKNIVEALIFASEEEITTRQIKEITDSSGVRISVKDIESSIDSLNEDYRTFNKSFEIVQIAGGYSFSTKKEYGRFVGKLFEEKQKKKLSQSALETLSIIAYKQPITRNEIEFVRGVNVDYIVNSLLERDLIKIHGRADTPGRPILYATTNTFLKVLGLNSLEDLPKLKEINEILKNQEIEGITEADIELFNSVNEQNLIVTKETGQLELITNENTENKLSIENVTTEDESYNRDENEDTSNNSFQIIEDKEIMDFADKTDNKNLETEEMDPSIQIGDDEEIEIDKITDNNVSEDFIENTDKGSFENIDKNTDNESDVNNADEFDNVESEIRINKENENNFDSNNENDFLTKEGEEDSL